MITECAHPHFDTKIVTKLSGQNILTSGPFWGGQARARKTSAVARSPFFAYPVTAERVASIPSAGRLGERGWPATGLASPPDPQRHRSPRDRRITVAPVVAAAGVQADILAVAAHDQAIAVVLDLVDPVRPRGRPRGADRDARFHETFGKVPTQGHAGAIAAFFAHPQSSS
jgi:hypothetical protein